MTTSTFAEHLPTMPGLRIGITYDLRDEYLAAGYGDEETAEFDQQDTIDGVADSLAKLGHAPDRIGNARQLVQRLARGDRWDLVFNICEGLRGIARESQVPAILDVFDIPYTFSDAAVLSLCLHKGHTKTIVQAAGVPTPQFAVIESFEDITRLIERIARHDDSPGFPAFAKPVAEGTGKGVTSASRVANATELRAVCEHLLRQFRQPVLVEQYLPGREFTTGITGTGPDTKVLGTYEIILLAGAEQDAYSFKNKKDWEGKITYRVLRPEEDEQVNRAEAIARKVWQVLGCRDAGRIDIRCDADGNPQFLEVNPLAGLRPGYSDLVLLADSLGVSYLELIRRIIDSAVRRLGR